MKRSRFTVFETPNSARNTGVSAQLHRSGSLQSSVTPYTEGEDESTLVLKKSLLEKVNIMRFRDYVSEVTDTLQLTLGFGEDAFQEKDEHALALVLKSLPAHVHSIHLRYIPVERSPATFAPVAHKLLLLMPQTIKTVIVNESLGKQLSMYYQICPDVMTGMINSIDTLQIACENDPINFRKSLLATVLGIAGVFRKLRLSMDELKALPTREITQLFSSFPQGFDIVFDRMPANIIEVKAYTACIKALPVNTRCKFQNELILVEKYYQEEAENVANDAARRPWVGC